MNEILLIVLGWALALLSPAVIDNIKQQREARRVAAALATELHQLRFRLAVACFGVRGRLGILDLPYLEWVKNHLSTHRGSLPRDRMILEVDKLISSSDGERRGMLDSLKVKNDRAIRLTKYGVPLLDSRVASLWAFQGKLQIALLELRTNMDMLNSEVDEATYYFRMSFDDRTPQQHEIVNNSINESCMRWNERAEKIVDQLQEVEPLLGKV